MSNSLLQNIINIFTKSLFTSIVIGYIIFNIVYFRNNCEMEQNIFWCQEGSMISDRSIIFDQPIIITEYVNWILKALTLDFGVFGLNDQTDVFNYALKALTLSFSMIFLTVLIGLFMSIILILLNRYSFVRKNIIDPLLSLSFIHLAIYAIYFKFFLTDSSFSSLFLLCLITSIGSGILFDFFTLLNNEHNFIMNKDYVTFARNSGFKPYRFASKEIIMSIIYISTSRVPIIFGSMIIIEILSQGNYKGIGFSIWLNIFGDPNYSAFFGSIFISIVTFTFIYYLTEFVKNKVLANE